MPAAPLDRFRAAHRRATGFDGPLPAVAFGTQRAVADELAALIAAGVKTATASVAAAYEAEGEPLPRVGDRSVVVDGSGSPVAVIEVQSVEVRRYGDIDTAHAHAEGEGDRTLTAWRAAHEAFLDDVCAELGLPFDDDLLLICERFVVTWPPDRDEAAT
jgi:uncharacterized protein YhfF